MAGDMTLSSSLANELAVFNVAGSAHIKDSGQIAIAGLRGQLRDRTNLFIKFVPRRGVSDSINVKASVLGRFSVIVNSTEIKLAQKTLAETSGLRVPFSSFHLLL